MMATVRLEVAGLNQLRLLNALRKQAITIFDLDRRSQKLMFVTILQANKANFFALAQKLGFVCNIASETSLKKSLLLCLSRVGLFVGIAVMIVVSAFAQSHLWKIEITGNDTVDELIILRALKSNGIEVGAKKAFDKEFVEEVLLSMDEISAVSASVEGTTLKVDIIESTKLTPSKLSGEVVSLYDAEIVRVVVNRGTAKVKIGDRVPFGAVLIEGIEYNTEGLPLYQVDAQGSVYGNVNFTYTETAALTLKKRSGNKITNTVIKLFGLNIGKNPKIIGEYETEKSISQIGSLLPLYAETTNYYELTNYEITLQELEKIITDKAVSNLVIKAGGSAISTNVDTKLISGNVYRITVHIEAELSIGGKKID